ncbi:MAG: cation:proton antiporter [Desulfobacteraceae bacterium]|nr:cation:proton antiporter [Desulfobacteraceae bacterium]
MDGFRAFLSEQMGHITLSTSAILVLGLLLFISLVTDALARRTSLPRISLLVMVGVGYAVVEQIIMGEPDFQPLGDLRESLISMALVMVAFLLGGELTTDRLKRTGTLILIVSLCVVAASAVVVLLGLTLLGYSLAIALSLAAISVATDPAAVTEVIRDSGDKSFKARVILGIVAVDDAWGIIVFGLCMAVLGWIFSDTGANAIFHAGWELGGAVLLGAILGFPAAWLTGRLEPGKPTQAEALALILLMTGLSTYLGVSALLTAMVAGFLIVNLSSHHERSFIEIEQIEWPFLVFFFVLAGASIDLEHMGTALGLLAAYIVLRVAGRYIGGYLGVLCLKRRSKGLPRHLGLSLMPQAGVAMGMALLAAERFPEEGNLIVAAVVTSTIVFELFGPVLVKWVIGKET